MSEQLPDKYRPRRLAQIVGQDKAVAKVRRLGENGFGGQAYFLTGKFGTGKSSMAGCIAAEVADQFFITTIDAGGMTPADVDAINQTWHTYAWGKKNGRAWVIEEAHGLRKDTLRALLVLLESGNIPKHCVFTFTTATEGKALFEDMQSDASPLLSRCSNIALASQGLAPVFARLVMRIAGREGLNGKPLSKYVKLLNKCKGNCRAALQAVAEGEMLG